MLQQDLRYVRSKKSSLAESATNVTVGYLIALSAWQLYFYASGHDVPVSHNAVMGAGLLFLSFGRLYVISRVFSRWFSR